MLSRTSARQQRMRQQTLNEERIAQDQLEPRTSSECRSKGSKLIISSPTTTSHPSLNILLSASQAPTQHIDDTTKLSNQYNRGFGASALLASLNANGQQHQTTSAHSTRLLLSTEDTQPVVSHLPDKNTQQSNLNLENYKSFLVTTNTTATQSFSVNNRNSIYTLTSNTVATTTTSNGKKTPNQTLPMHFAQRNVAQGHTQFHLQSKHNSFESVSPNTQLKSNSEFSGLEVESNESPTPSDMNSPVESCFANIMEDQGSDSFDLNNITPSINLSSSVGVSNSTVDFPHQTCDSSERLQQSTTKSTMPIMANKLDSLVQISPVDVNSLFLKENHKLNRDEACMKVSSSCPAVVPEDLQHVLDNASPVQSGSRAPQSVLSESGSSPLGGMNSTPEASSIPMNHGSLGVGSLSSSAGNRCVDDQRVAWMRDRTKKDSHNRIERKRRDYINCQIAELGNLLPEDMFRDGDGKKNKGNILKNSVEFICLLRSELAQIPEVRRETSLAAKVIGQLVKRIQELESVTNVTSAQPQGSRNSSDYQSLLQEWVMLHENNLQNAVPIDTTNSPITRYSFPMNITDTAGSSSPGLSSVGTEEMINSDTKVIFSNSVPVPIVGSAPVPSNPLGSCSRMNSPISNMNIVSRPAGCGGSSATDSSLRLMRTRCTSLTVSTVGANSLSSDANIPGVRLHGSEYQSQANRLKSQRILQPHQSSHLRIFQPGNNHSGVGVSQTPLRGSQQFQSKPIPQSHLPSSSLSPQHNFIVQHQVNPSSSSGLGLTVRSNPNQELTNSHCLSASLPVNVNPLLCGLQDSDISDVTDDKSSQLYSFDSSSSFIVPQLKSEPICETDSMYGTMHSLGLELSHGNTGNTILEPVTHFDPLIASVVQTSHQHYHQQQQQERNHPHHYHHHHLQQQQQQQLHQQSHHHHLQQQYPLFNHTGMTSSKAVDSSTPPIGLDIDDFQFDDVPME
ncbi:unnamed protein product [Heterobilharzia americana]|nr:unnamed protein product [Heterobilharzia americana]